MVVVLSLVYTRDILCSGLYVDLFADFCFVNLHKVSELRIFFV